jgi:clan AA aspartic protease (TIGR02281 family)
MYASGRGVPQSYAEAVKWYRKAADAGYADARFNLGAAYANGQGVQQSPAQAYMWLNLAASGTAGDKQKQYADARDELARKMTSEQIAEAQAAANGDKQAQNNLGAKDSKRFVPMLQEGGIYKVPVLINNAITLNFVVDSGTTDVSIPADVVTTLMRTGTITQSDFIGTQTYTLADGSTTSSRTFRVRSLKIGDIILQNVTGSVANANGDLLLGQSFLGRFKSWSIDNPKHSLILE